MSANNRSWVRGRGEPEHVPAHPPVDIIATVTGASDQIEAAIPGEVDKHTADTDARECIIHQARLPVAAACPAEPVELFRNARRDGEFGHPVVVQISNDTRHALGRRLLVDGVPTKEKTIITGFMGTHW